ncbi:MAG: hypothetical protein V4596_01115 [Bdellovibrionota bacterium]
MNLLRFFAVAFVCSFALFANAEYQMDASQFKLGSFDFIAPVVSDESDVSDKEAGLIIFDASTEQFKGYSTTGAFVSLSAAGGNSVVGSPGSSEKVTRALLNNTQTTGGVTSQSGSWITYSSCSGAGNCTYTISGYSAAPACVCSPDNVTANVCTVKSITSTTLNVITVGSAFSGVNENNTKIICMGPN